MRRLSLHRVAEARCACDIKVQNLTTTNCKKDLDSNVRPTLYKNARAFEGLRNYARKDTKMMSRTYLKHTVKPQTRATWCDLSLSLSPINQFGGELGQERSIDSRYIRQ